MTVLIGLLTVFGNHTLGWVFVSVSQKDQLELLLMMDLIAIQDLQAGDELVLAMDIDSISGDWVLSPDLLPAHWITTTSPT